MELPPYRFPTIRGLLIHTWERTYQYIKKAGTVILGISILLWALMTFPGLSDQQLASFEQQRQEIISSFSSETFAGLKMNSDNFSEETKALAEKLREINNHETEATLRHSFAGRVGGAVESFSKFAGFDWRTNIALIGGFAAKEVIVSTLGTAYSMGEVDVEESASLGQRLKNDSKWNRVVAVAALVFIMFYAPCFITVVCIAKESSWKWAFFSIGFNTVFAFFAAVAVFQIGTFFQLG